MSYLVTIYEPQRVAAPWGYVDVIWSEPDHLKLGIYHAADLHKGETNSTYRYFYASSFFDGAVSITRGRRLALRVEHRRSYQYCHLSSQVRLRTPHRVDHSEVNQWEDLLGRWAEEWILGRTPESVLARALAFHNRYAMLRHEHHDAPPDARQAYMEKMRRAAIRALPAVEWMLQLNHRRPVREWALVHYLPLVGRRRHTITVADLRLGEP